MRPRDARAGARAAAARAARPAAARLPGRPRLGARLRGEGGRVHPDHRRAGPPVLGLPRVQLGQARPRQGARARLDRDALADGQRVSAARVCYSKFFDSDLEPLVEVVRDTVGRHDTFGLACTRKYYEDMGYFGHVNCSDNFNAELDAVRDRAARGLAGDQLLLQHRVRRRQPLRRRRALVAAGRLRAAACDRPTSSASRARAPTTSTRRTRGTRPRCTSASTRPRSGSRPRSPTASRPTPSRS